jgi:hypothetical protein
MFQDDKIITVTETVLTLMKLHFVGPLKVVQTTLEGRTESSVNDYKFYTETHLRAVLAAHEREVLFHIIVFITTTASRI